MCYIITAYIDNEFYTESFQKICQHYYLMPELTNNHLKRFDQEKISSFYFTGSFCDCDTPIGSGKDKKDLKTYLSFFRELKICKDAKHIFMLKHWYSDEPFNDDEIECEEIHVDDMDTKYLSHIRDDILYKILLHQKYY